MTAPIGSVDNQIVAVIRLIGQAALDDTSGERRHLCRFGDGIVGRRALKAMLGKGALHGQDDVAAVTQAAKRTVHACGKLDRQSAVEGKRGAVRGGLGGSRITKNKSR